MKEFLIAFCIVAAIIFGINKFGNFNSQTKLSLADAISQCSQNIDANKCSVESVMNNIKEKSLRQYTSKNHYTVWDIDNNLVDLYSVIEGNIFIDTTNLNQQQISVWNAYLAESKRQQRNEYMNDNNIFGIAVAVILFLAAIWIFVVLVPFVWRFLLRRISEVSKAVKGDKFD